MAKSDSGGSEEKQTEEQFHPCSMLRGRNCVNHNFKDLSPSFNAKSVVGGRITPPLSDRLHLGFACVIPHIVGSSGMGDRLRSPFCATSRVTPCHLEHSPTTGSSVEFHGRLRCRPITSAFEIEGLHEFLYNLKLSTKQHPSRTTFEIGRAHV